MARPFLHPDHRKALETFFAILQPFFADLPKGTEDFYRVRGLALSPQPNLHQLGSNLAVIRDNLGRLSTVADALETIVNNAMWALTWPVEGEFLHAMEIQRKSLLEGGEE